MTQPEYIWSRTGSKNTRRMESRERRNEQEQKFKYDELSDKCLPIWNINIVYILDWVKYIYVYKVLYLSGHKLESCSIGHY